MPELHLTYLNGPDVEALALTDDEILAAVESGLRAQGRGETVIEPRMHLRPDAAFRGHFNVLRGYIAPLGARRRQGRGRFRRQLPARPAVRDRPADPVRPAHGRAAGHDRRRRAHRHAHRRRHGDRRAPPRAPDARVLGHIGARGTAYWNVRLLDHLFDLDEIRVHSRRPESREAFGAQLERDLGKPVRVCDDWDSCVAAPTSSSRPRASSARSRCCGRSGSSPAPSSFPTAR